MPAPFTTPVARSVPVDNVATENALVGDNVQDYFNLLSGPNFSHASTYLANGEVDTITIYRTATQIIANRVALVTIGYDGLLNPITETWQYFKPTDGTTIIKTVVLTHTFTGVDLTNTTTVTT